MKTILISEKLPAAAEEKLRTCARKYGYETIFCSGTKEALPYAPEAEIIYGNSVALSKAGTNLKWMCAMSAGVNPYLKEGAFASKDCILSDSSGSYGTCIAEHLIMVTLMLLHRIPEYTAEMAQREWHGGKKIHSIKGSRILVLGTGDIGTTFAKRAKAFEPERIVGISRSKKGDPGLFDVLDVSGRLERYLPETDILVMSVPETPDTIGILSGERIQMLPETAYVVNVGRGSAIDDAALIEALNTGKLAGAALDVTRTEPLPREDPLWSAKNILLTPHIAGQWTLEHTILTSVDLFCEDFENYCEGRPLKRQVDLTIGY